jgi:hypothetical protein
VCDRATEQQAGHKWVTGEELRRTTDSLGMVGKHPGDHLSHISMPGFPDEVQTKGILILGLQFHVLEPAVGFA